MTDTPSTSEDRLVVAIADDGSLRARVAIITDSVREAMRRHAPGPLGARALARALATVAVYPHDNFKDLERISFQWSGGGPLQTAFAELRAPGHLRAYVANPHAMFSHEAEAGVRGHGLGLLPGGTLSVIMQKPTGAFSQGHVALHSGEVDEDAERYFEESLQVATRVRSIFLGSEATQDFAAGALVQRLPGADDVELVSGQALGSADIDVTSAEEQLFDCAFGGKAFRVLERTPLSFTCSCSKDRIAAGLKALDVNTLSTLRDEDKGAHIRCDFCTEEYEFSEADIEALIQAKQGS